MKTHIYGPHITLDCYGCSIHALANITTVYDFLNQLPKALLMEKIGPPQIALIEEEEIYGITGIVMITTSHISIHTYPLKAIAMIDIFSCKNIEVDLIKKTISNSFDPYAMDLHEYVRGKKFPEENLYTIDDL